MNAAAKVYSPLPPQGFLEWVQGLEADCARVRHRRWAPRTLDIDVLACGARVLPDRQTVQKWMDFSLAEQQARVAPELLLPHPRLHQRGFVLRPLMDVASDWTHPILGKTVADLLEALPPEALHGIAPL